MQGVVWVRAARMMFRNIVLHVANMKGGEAVQASEVASFVATRDLLSLGAALLSSDDAGIRGGWRVFMLTDSGMRETILERVEAALSSLAGALITRGEIKQLADSVEF